MEKAKKTLEDAIIEIMLQFPYGRGPQYRPPNNIILIMGTPQKAPLILGNPETLSPMVTPISPFKGAPNFLGFRV